MHKLYELKEKLINELEDYAENGKFSKEDVEAIKYTASAIDHICNIVNDDTESEYSGNVPYEGGRSYARGGNGRRGSYRSSYARGRKRDSMGRYSSAADDMIMELREIMQDAPDQQTRNEFERLISKLENM